MKVREYLQAKYKQKYPTTCLWAEASILGIPYPLEPTWLVTYGEVEITADQSAKIRKRLTTNLSKPNKSAEWAEAGLKALARSDIIERSANLYSREDKFSSPDWQHAVAAVYALNKHLCSVCRSNSGGLTVKHIHDVPALFLDYDNLIVLCAGCSVKKGQELQTSGSRKKSKHVRQDELQESGKPA